MKKFNLILIFFSILFLQACKNDNQNTEKDNPTEETIKLDTTKKTISGDTVTSESNDLQLEYTSKYICPAHCEKSGSKDPGECPVCGMEYISNPDFQ